MYAEQPHTPIEEASSQWPSGGTGAWPTPAEADAFAALLRSRALEVASIGCGEGAFEAMLERRGVTVHAVDLDVLRNPEGYATIRRFCSEVRRVRPDALFDIPNAARTAICFFWPRNAPWRAYLAAYPQAPICCLLGEGAQEAETETCATLPSANALDGVAGWRCISRTQVRAVSRRAMLNVYERE